MASVGRPREPELDQRILHATVEVLVERGLKGLRMDEVARVAGTPKSTIYRRWPSSRRLVVDAMAHAVGHVEPPQPGDPAEDLRGIAAQLSAVLASPTGAALVQLGAELSDDPELSADYRARLVDPNRDAAIDAVRRGQAAGVFRADADAELAVDGAIGALVYRALILRMPLDAALGQAVTRELFARLAPPAEAETGPR